MKKVQRFLLAILITTCLLLVIMALLFETNVLPCGILEENKKTEFWAAIILEIVTICVIPLALWLFKMGKIHHALSKGKETVLLRWGSFRLLLLCIPLLANALCYWLFMAPTFAYMAIMLFISLFFIFPSMERCVVETTETVGKEDSLDNKNDISEE